MPFLTDSNPPSYNGYTFPESVETVGFEAEPVPDETRRTFQYVRYRITLQWEVCAAVGNNIDTTMAALRTTLMQHGQAFSYKNRGFGADWAINDGLNFYDVDGGPWPVGFSFKPKGKNQGATVTWVVMVSVPTNCAAILYQGVPMTFAYRIGIRIDRHGLSTRTCTGYLAVPKIVNDEIHIADDYIDVILPQLIDYFQRVERNYQHSFDKKRVDFTVIDEEMGERALPAACTAASASHTINSTDRGWLTWQGVISASYTLEKYAPQKAAWNHFYRMLKARLELAKANLQMDGDEKADEQKPKEKGQIVITGFTLGEPEIYGQNVAAFSVTYTMTTTLKSQFGGDNFQNGLFFYDWEFGGNGPGTWAGWWRSTDLTQRNRGIANLRLNTNSDVIVDLCTTAPPRPITQEADFTGGTGDNPIDDILSLQPEPDSESSWFFYEPEIDIIEDQHAVVSSNLSDPYNPYESSPGNLEDQGYTPDNNKGDPTDGVQYRAPSTLYIYISGRACRAWFNIHRPKIVSFKGMQVKEVSTEGEGCYWRHKCVGNMGIGMPIYYAEFRFKYVVTDRPTEPIKSPESRYEQE